MQNMTFSTNAKHKKDNDGKGAQTMRLTQRNVGETWEKQSEMKLNTIQNNTVHGLEKMHAKCYGD